MKELKGFYFLSGLGFKQTSHDQGFVLRMNGTLRFRFTYLYYTQWCWLSLELDSDTNCAQIILSNLNFIKY